MANTAQLKQVYKDQIAPELMKKFNYTSPIFVVKECMNFLRNWYV